MALTTRTTTSFARLARGSSIVALSGALWLSGTGIALAQDTDLPATIEDSADIVVTGLQASIENAVRTKRDEVAIVESVTAEDIGKLPDVSIAESIARLPGLTAQRIEGRGQGVSIRGLGPEFSTALLNGREQVTTGDNRGVEFDQYPAELLNSVVVYKTPEAGLIGQGLAGTVDLRTIRPLAQRDTILAFQARYERNDQGSLNPDSPRDGYRLSAVYADQFMDGQLGVALGIAAQSTPTQNERFNAWGYPTNNAGQFILGGAKPYVQSNELQRIGVIGTLEFESEGNFHSVLDVFYSDFREDQRLRGIEFPLFWDGDTVSFTPTGTPASTGFVDGTYTGVFAMQRNDYNRRDAQTFSIGWNNELNLTDNLRFTVDVAYSMAQRDDFLLESYTGTGNRSSGRPDTVTVTRQPNGGYTFSTLLNYADPNLFVLTDAQGWGGNAVGGAALTQAGFLNAPSFDDELTAVRAELAGDFEMGPFSGWEIGGNFSWRQKDSRYRSFFLRLPNNALQLPVPAAALIGSTVSLDYLGIPAMLTYDPLYVYNNIYVPQEDIRPDTITRDYRVNEDVFVGYAKLNIDGELGSIPVRGNVGVQFVHTDQSSTGRSANRVGDVVTIVNLQGSANYSDFLPSLNLSFEVADNLFVRVGAARTLARARLDQMRVTQNITTVASQLTVSDPNNSYFRSNGGNINLQPYFANGIDLSVERYFGGAGYVSVALFYKRLTNFVEENRSYVFDFSDAVSSFLTPAQAALLGTPLGLVSAPANSGRGRIQGFEATLSLPFRALVPALEGFGIQSSVSYTDSRIRFGTGNPITIPGLSRWVSNTTAYFERAGFQLRGSYRYRSSFLGEVSGISASRVFRTVAAESIVDAQVGYTFQDGSPLEGLALTLQGQNLTNEPFTTYQNNDPAQVIDYQRYGRTFLLGASYRF